MLQYDSIYPSGARLLEKGIDWVRLSWPGGLSAEAPSFDQARAWYDTYVLGSETVDSPRPANLLGYVGRAYGAMWLGERGGDVLFQCTGAAARQIFRLGGLGRAACTRLDIQATLVSMRRPADVIRSMQRVVLRERDGREGRPFHVKHIDGHGDGDSLLVNARTNPEYIRIYDKEAESGDPERYQNGVRLEVELKADASRAAWQMLCTSLEPAGTAMDMLAGCLAKRGLTGFESILGAEVLLLDICRPETDAERKLRWLETQVQPTVRWLLRHGYQDGTMYALGLE